MSVREQYEVVIVGGGPAGLCAALYGGRGMLRTVLLERGVPGGELLNTEWIEDYPGFPKVKGRELAALMTQHALQFGAEIRQENAESIARRADGIFEVTTSLGTIFEAPAVIITAGGTPLKLEVPGEIEYAGRGVSYCAVCDGAFFKGETIAVIGGGDAAVEEADYLTRYAEKVYLIHRRGELRASKILQERLFANPKIEVIWNKRVLELFGDPSGLKTIALEDTETGQLSELKATGCFVFIGFRPNSGLVQQHFAHDASGYMITDDRMMTSIPGLFAAGGLRVQLTRQVTTAVGDATTAAIAVEKFLTERRQSGAAAQAGRTPVSELVVGKFTNGRFGQNSYLLGDAASRAAVLVDPGEEPGELLDAVMRDGWKVGAIWLTHAHIDHVLGVPAARDLTSAPVLLHAEDEPLYANVPQQAGWMGFVAPSLPAPDGRLHDGQVLQVGAHRFTVRHTPGHSPGSVSFIGPGCVVAGDVLFSGSIGRTDLPGGDFFTLMRSIHTHLLSLSDDTVLYAGHGDDSTIGIERATNPFITGEVRAG